MADEFQALISAELQLDKVESQIKELNNRKISLDVEVKKDATKQLTSNIEKGLKAAKVDTSSISKQLANSFNISDKSVIGKMKTQINSMLNDLSKTWDGGKFDFSKANGFYSGMDKLGEIVTQNAKIIESKTGIYEKFYDYFKNTKVFVSDELKNAMGNDLYKEISSMNIGKIVRDASKGISINNIWSELTESFPQHFSENITNEVDQITKVFEVLKDARADVAKTLSFDDMSDLQRSEISSSVYEQVADMSKKIKESLEQNIQAATEDSKSTFDLDVDINTEKIISDIRSALQTASGSVDDALNVNLKLNDEEIATDLRSAIAKISGNSDDPIAIALDIQVNKESLQSDLNTALNDLDLPINFNVDAAQLESDIRKAIDNMDIDINVKVNTNGTQTENNGVIPDLMEPVDETKPIKVKYTADESSIQNVISTSERIFDFFTGTNVIDFSSDKIREAISDLKELNTQLVEIDKTSNLSQKALNSLAENSFDEASKYGSLVADYMNSAGEFAKAGYSNLDEITETAMLTQIAGNVTADTANKYLISTDAAYKYKGAVSELTKVIDGANNIANKFSVEVDDIASATTLSASFAAQAGVEVDQLTAATGTMAAVTKRSGSEMGRAFRSILLNLQQVSGEFDGENIDEEQLKKVEARCHSLGVELEYLNNGVATLRNPMEVLKDLSEVYRSLPDDSADKQGLISDLGGKYYANALSALLDNWDIYEKMLNTYASGEGSAMREAMKTADSWQGHLNSLSNTWLEFVSGLANVDAIKGGISFLDGMISSFDKLNDAQLFVPTMLSSIMSLRNVLTGKGLTDVSFSEDGTGSLGKIDLKGSFLGIDLTKIGDFKKHMAEAENELARWNKEVLSGQVSIEDFGGEFVKQNKNFKDYLSTLDGASGTLEGYQNYLKGTGEYQQKFSTSLKGFALNAISGFLTGIAIQLGLAAITKVIDSTIRAEEKAVEKMNNSVADYTEAQSEVESINSELDDTASKIDELNAKQNLSFTDKKELENLQNITRELENQKRIAEENELIQGKKAVKDTIDAFNEQYKDDKGIITQGKIDEYVSNASITGNNAILTTDTRDLNALMAALEQYKKMKQEALDTGDQEEAQRIQKNLIDGIDSQIWEEISNLQTYKDTLSNLPEEALGNTGKELLSNIEDTINYVMKNLDSYTNTENMIDNIFAKAKFDGVKDSLVSAGKTGTDALNSLILSTPGLTDALDEAGVSAQELADYIMAIADPEALNLENVKKILEEDFAPDLDDDANGNIKAARQKIWDEFADGKSDEEIEIFYKYVNENDLDISDWNADDLSLNFDRASESAKEAAKSVKSFYDIMSDTEDGNFNEALDNYQSSLETLSTSLKSFKSGELSDAGIFDLIQQFPELAHETDNLEAGLTKLMNVQMNNSLALIDDQIKQLKETGEDASGFEAIRENLIKTFDLSDMDVKSIKDILEDAYVPDKNLYARAAKDAKAKWDDFTSGMTDEDYEVLYKLSLDTDSATWTIEEWKSKYEAEKVTMGLGINESPMLDEYNKAKETENAGDRYLEMKSAFEEAQKAYKEGLVGTDDFKTAAALLSPNAMEDADNWQENYGKVLRYFTDDSEGVRNFLNDLSTKTNEAGEALATYNSETGEWAYNISDVQAAADSMGISFEAFTAIMGRLQDYGFSNDFFGNIEEGTDHLTDLYGELSSAEIKLQELKEAQTAGDNTVTDTVIEAQEAKVQQIRDSIATTQTYLDQMLARTASDYEAESKSAENVGKSLIEQYNNTDNSSVRQMILDDLSGLENEYHIQIVYDTEGNPVELVTQGIEESQETADNNPVKIPVETTQSGSPEVPKVPTVQEVAAETLSIGVHYDVQNPEEPKAQIEGDTATLPVEPEVVDDVSVETTEAEIPVGVNTDQATQDFQQLVDKITSESAIMKIDGNNDSAKEKADEAVKYTDKQTGVMTIDGNKEPAISEANAAASEINSMTPKMQVGANTESLISSINSILANSSFSINVSANVSGLPSSNSGGEPSSALGTAHAQGTVLDMWDGYRHSIGAYAGGSAQDWALPQNENALVNETGKPESIVRNGRWFMIPGGAHIQSLKKGDIIFNAAQTQELLKNGRVISGGGHGRVALANGTAYNMMPAHSNTTRTGSGGGGGRFAGGAANGSSSSGTSGTPKTQTPRTSSNTNNNSNSNKKSKEYFDWIEVAVKRVESAISRLADKVGDVYSKWSSRNKNLTSEIENVSKELSIQEAGRKRYLQQAATINLSNDWKEKVKNGKIDIDTITDDNLKEKLKDYQTWIDKAKECTDKIAELKLTEKELAEQRLQNISDQYDEKVQYYERKNSKIQSTLDVDRVTGKNLGTTYVKDAARNSRSETKAQLRGQLKAYGKGGNVNLLKRPVINASKLVKAGWKDAGEGKATVYSSTFSNAAADKKKKDGIAMNFTPIITDSKGKFKGVMSPEELQKYAEEVISGVRKDDLKLKIGATFKGKDAIKDAETAAEKIHKLQDKYYLGDDSSKSKKKSTNTQKRQYNALIKNSKSEVKALTTQKSDLQNEFYSLVADGTIKKGSEKWYEWKDKLGEIDESINQCKVDQAEWNEAIANLPIDKLKNANERLQVKADSIQRNISIKEVRGSSASKTDYANLIDNSKSQNKNYEEQNKLLIKQRDLYDKGTDKWKEYQSQIDSNTEAIDNNIQAMIEWGQAIINLPFEQRDKKLEKNQNKRDVYESNYEVAQTAKGKNKILRKEDALAKKDRQIYIDAVRKAETNVYETADKAAMLGAFSTKANKGKDIGEKLSLKGLKKGSDAYQAVVDYNYALEKQAEAERDAEIAVNNTTKALQENAKTRFDNVASERDLIEQSTSDKLETKGAYIDMRRATGQSLTSDYQKKYLSQQLDLAKTDAKNKKNTRKALEEAYEINAQNMSKEDKIAAQSAIEKARQAEYAARAEVAEQEKALYEIDIDRLEISQERHKADQQELEDQIQLKNTRGIDTTANDYKNLIKNSDTQLGNLEKRKKLIEDEISTLDFHQNSEQWQEAQSRLDAINREIADNKVSQEEWNNAIAELPYNTLEEELELLDAIAASNESAVSLKAKQGQDLSEDDYLTQIQDNDDQIAKLEEERKQAFLDYQKALAAPDNVYGGKTAEEWVQKYAQLDTEINNTLSENEELKDSLRDDVYWRDFERAHEAAQRTKDTIEGIAELISDDMLYDSDGKLTDFGVSKVATLVKEYELASEEVQNYTDDIKNLHKLYADGQYTELEYTEKLAELKQGLLDSASSMKTYTDTIVDMYKEMGQAELDSLFELIDARNDALAAKKACIAMRVSI